MGYAQSIESEYRHLRENFAREDSLNAGNVIDLANLAYRKRQELSRDELRELVSKVPAEQLNELYFEVKAQEVFPELERVVFGELRRKNVVDYKVVPPRAYVPYGQAKQKLEQAAEKDKQSPLYIVENGKIRPPTFKQTLEMKLNDLETKFDAAGNERSNKDRVRLFNRWLDSCTGVAYNSKDKNLFKIITKSQDLIDLPHNFKGYFVPIDYAKIDGDELKRSEAIYRQRLTPDQVLKHKAWLAAVDGDKQLLLDYVKGLQEAYRLDGRSVPEKLMGFYIRPKSDISKDQLRALCVSNLVNESVAVDSWILNDSARFLRVSQNQPRNPKG